MMHILLNKINQIDKEKKYQISVILLIILGISVRIIGISTMPNALNADEASAGYEAYAIHKYGIDRNGNFLPVFLQAWGSGQNALLTYLIIPFVKILGLNVLAVRLPMAIIGSISVVIIYLILRKITNKKVALIGLAFFAICPWHIMKSRWGLESNLFPDLILLAIYLLIKGIEDERKWIYYSSFFVFGLSAYAYGTSYFFLPLCIIPTLIILIKRKKITIKQSIISLAIVALTSMPIIIYVIINTLDLPQINLPFMTIPKLEVNRFQQITSIFSKEFFKISMQNIESSFNILMKQYDGLPWNAVQGYGIIYLFSIIFTVIGIIRAFSKKIEEGVKYNIIFNIWFIVALALTPVCDPNINRLNIIMIPIIYYTILGIDIVTSNKVESIKYGIITMYIISFFTFILAYKEQDSNQFFTFENGLQEPIEYLQKAEDKQIYVTQNIKEPYIYVLFYSKYNTPEFVQTVKYQDKYVEFRKVTEFGNYHFQDIATIENNKNNVYMIKKEDKNKYNLKDFKVKEFEKYIIVEGTK